MEDVASTSCFTHQISRYVDESMQLYNQGYEKVNVIYHLLSGLFELLSRHHQQSCYVSFLERNRRRKNVYYLHVIQTPLRVQQSFEEETREFTSRVICTKPLVAPSFDERLHEDDNQNSNDENSPPLSSKKLSPRHVFKHRFGNMWSSLKWKKTATPPSVVTSLPQLPLDDGGGQTYQVLELMIAPIQNCPPNEPEVLDIIHRYTKNWGPSTMSPLHKRRGWLFTTSPPKTADGVHRTMCNSVTNALGVFRVLYKQKHLKRGKDLNERIYNEIVQTMDIPLIVFDVREQTTPAAFVGADHDESSVPDIIDPRKMICTFVNDAFRTLVQGSDDLDASPRDQQYQDETTHTFHAFINHPDIYECLYTVMNGGDTESGNSAEQEKDDRETVDHSWGSGSLLASSRRGRGKSITKTIEYGDNVIPLRHYELHIYRVNGTRVGIVMKDISEKIKHLQLIEQASKAKTEFLANINHEFRTPLNSIDGNLQLLMRTPPLSDRQMDLIHRMRLSGTALMSLLQEVLDYAKLEQRRMKLHLETFSLRHCLQSALDVLASAANAKQVVLDYHMAIDTPSLVIGDSFRLQQVLVNLLTNAINFTPNGGSVTIKVETIPSNDIELPAASMVHVKFSVIDTGTGVDVEAQKTLFDPWAQGDLLKARGTRGTGLGLAICKELVTLMNGGRIWLEHTAPGKGSTFCFVIPMACDVDLNSYSCGVGGVAKHELALLKEKQIIILQSDDEHKRGLVKLLLGWGIRPTCCTTPEEVIEYLAAGYEFQVALLELCWACEPDTSSLSSSLSSSALTLASWITLNQPPLALVGLVNANGDVHDEQCVSLFRAVLTKPVKPEGLFHTLVNIFDFTTREKDDDKALSPRKPLRSLSKRGGSGVPKNADMCILIVEDVLENRQVLIDMLHMLGYNDLLVAENGQEMLDVLKSSQRDGRRISLVLVDLLMPEMNGLDAVKEYRAWSNHSVGTLPYIIAVTATTNIISDDPTSYVAAGMDAFIQKPIKMTDLQTLLELVPPYDEENDSSQ